MIRFDSMVGVRPSFYMLALLVLTSRIEAQPHAAKQRAQRYFEQADTAAARGNHVEAATLRLQSYSTFPEPSILSRIGDDYQHAGDARLAHKYFCEYLRATPNGPLRQHAVEGATDAARQLDLTTTQDPCELASAPPPTTAPTALEPLPVKSAPSTRGTGTRITGVALGGAGVVALGVGGYFAYRGYQYKKTIDAHEDGAPWTDEERRIDTQLGPAANRNAYIFAGVGAALLVGGVLVYALSPSANTTPEASVWTPLVSPDTVGFSYAARY